MRKFHACILKTYGDEVNICKSVNYNKGSTVQLVYMDHQTYAPMTVTQTASY